MNLNPGSNISRHGILVSNEYLDFIIGAIFFVLLHFFCINVSSQHVVGSNLGFTSNATNIYESAYLLNTSYIGLRNHNELILSSSRYRNNQIYFGHPKTKYDYYNHIFTSFTLNDSIHKTTIGILAENHTDDVSLFSESSLSTMVASSFYTKKWEIRPSLALSIRHDYLNLPHIYKIHPQYFTMFNLEEPSLPSNQYVFMLGFSTLLLHKNYSFGLSLKNITQPQINFIHHSFASNVSMIVTGSYVKSIFAKNKIFEMEPFFVFNYQYINGASSSLVANLKMRYNNFNQFVGGVNWHSKKFLYVTKIGIYPPLFIGKSPYKTDLNNEWLTVKEFGLGFGRKFTFKSELIYNITFVSNSHVSAFHIWGLPQSVRFHQLSYKYVFGSK